ncbi:MAG TPA: septum formation protein Maf [Candidatus Lachnoclostridium stercorigallinarum]|uniref:dTTP/UTP pyrophosphatase n=1 Tax=Candidatus Lachnoclostridium stercorigallinarum TaxID=2838634 RepID=A0A9D2K588_9FIRM|nr:septum formation protein Maf [Candidatus Lachnoclostridium stercorigallinarum]
MRIVLASGSPRRRELMEQIGIRTEVMPSSVEERVTSDIPDQVVLELSGQKAEDVAEKTEGRDVLVIGADTVVASEGRILGKPGSVAEAGEMIASLAGKCHQVYTGVTLIYRDPSGEMRRKAFAERTDVYVYPMDEEEIRGYAGCGEPMDKAGAYGIQGRFAAYVEKIDGDYNNVVGLPVGRLYQEIKELTGGWNA